MVRLVTFRLENRSVEGWLGTDPTHGWSWSSSTTNRRHPLGEEADM